MQKLEPGEPLLADESLSTNILGMIDDLRWGVALDIVRHCALISAEQDGEDSGGRQKLRLLSCEQVAQRALDIADHMVEGAIGRGWLFKRTTTSEEAARNLGRLERIRMRAELLKDEPVT